MRKINLSKRAHAFLKGRPPKLGKQLAQKLLALTLNPTPHDSKKLSGRDYLRVDCGEFRIIYEFDAQEIKVILIGKRNDDEVYRKLSRL